MIKAFFLLALLSQSVITSGFQKPNNGKKFQEMRVSGKNKNNHPRRNEHSRVITILANRDQSNQKNAPVNAKNIPEDVLENIPDNQNQLFNAITLVAGTTVGAGIPNIHHYHCIYICIS